MNGAVYDAANQLTQWQGTTLSYDALGRRTTKTVNGTTTGYLYDGYDGANLVQELTDGTPSANLLTGLAIDEVFARTDATGMQSFLTDALGSTVALADDAGTVQTEYTYDPFGNTTASGSASTNTTQYTGRENDGTGLYYYRARYYSPSLQCFISQDPLGFGGGDVNLYGYVANSPTNYTDPSGPSVGRPGTSATSLGGRKHYIEGFDDGQFAGGGPGIGPQSGEKIVDRIGRWIRGLFGRGGNNASSESSAGPSFIEAAPIPQEARDVLAYIETHNWTPQQGYKGGKTYENSTKLRPPEGRYKECDVRAKEQDKPRGTERIAVDTRTGAAWYTPDHYDTFIRIR